MKEQYFGDINDYQKYSLLRLLAGKSCFRLGVCWMLTESDGRSDGNRLAYLNQPAKFRKCDPKLFDWLAQTVGVEKDRRVARIEQSSLLGNAQFHSDLLSDDRQKRTNYFDLCDQRLAGADLVFFDPDNGLEVPSVKLGAKGSSKYLYWEELTRTFHSGSSVLIYQHFIRESREKFTSRLCHALSSRLSSPSVFWFSMPHVVFLLAAHAAHAEIIRGQFAGIQEAWVDQIDPKEF